MSKRQLLFILILGVIVPVAGYFAFSYIPALSRVVTPGVEELSGSPEEMALEGIPGEALPTRPASPFDPNRMAIYFSPEAIYIDSIGLTLGIVEIGVEENGALGVPSNWEDAGWYKEGPRPGERGNLIIAAHYDTNTGAPAAFWQLKNVKVDDTVTLVDEHGREYSYSVSDSFYVDIQDPNRLEVFADTSEPTVTLITCGGVWIPGEGYSRRLVVKGELIQ